MSYVRLFDCNGELVKELPAAVFAHQRIITLQFPDPPPKYLDGAELRVRVRHFERQPPRLRGGPRGSRRIGGRVYKEIE